MYGGSSVPGGVGGGAEPVFEWRHRPQALSVPTGTAFSFCLPLYPSVTIQHPQLNSVFRMACLGNHTCLREWLTRKLMVAERAREYYCYYKITRLVFTASVQ